MFDDGQKLVERLELFLRRLTNQRRRFVIVSCSTFCINDEIQFGIEARQWRRIGDELE